MFDQLQTVWKLLMRMQIARASRFDQARHVHDEPWGDSNEFIWDQYIAKEELIRYAVSRYIMHWALLTHPPFQGPIPLYFL